MPAETPTDPPPPSLWEVAKSWLTLPTMPSLNETEQQWRVHVFERNIGLPIKAGVLLVLFYYFFIAKTAAEPASRQDIALVGLTWTYAHQVAQYVFIGYMAINIGVAFVLVGMRSVSSLALQWTVFGLALIDGLFLALVLVLTGGVKSMAYWLFPLLALRNSVSISAVVPQLGLNFLLCAFFAGAVSVEATIARMDEAAERREELIEFTGNWVWPFDLGAEFNLRLALLAGLAVWAYGMQVVLDRQRRQVQEQHELALRREQMELSSRLAAEIAHQLKNPLAIINNASYTLQKTVKEGKTITQQIAIIREEVARSDQLITELMGYAKLTDGKVEKLDVRQELEEALLQALPPAVKYDITVHRQYADALPHLLALRKHVNEIFVNLIQNAREAMNGRGNLWVTTAHGPDHSILVTIEDDGPGIRPEHLERVFEPYFTTREKGTGLGLAIVKHNTELYGGRVRVESALGKGTRFILQFPARTLMRLRR